ncbi:MAG: hypothetical protein H7Y07_11995 [Pyrinomonadaceae bacterium]|nr:hypothetical protein [Sphingobacteriaceae bacterium]
MFKKVLLNVFYNIAIITIVLCLFWGFNKEHYSIVLVSVFALGLFIFFKLRLIKDVKQASTKKVK